jgi:3-phosphoshikimate 1-carboxyvinyltransferase
MNILDLPRFERPASGIVSVPGSKSINNRALLLAALAQGTSTLTGALDSDDTRIFASCLESLGFAVRHDRDAETFTVTGCGGYLSASASATPDLFVGNAGTAARFLLALCALRQGPVRFDGVPAMRKRPMGDLLELLALQGAEITPEGAPGYFPLTLKGSGLPGGALSLDPSRSSQQVSAALMVAPYARTDTTLTLTGEIVSEPYIAMTIAMMADWGVVVERPEPHRLIVRAGQKYRAKASYAVEPDASSASYFFAAAAVTGGTVTVRGLSRGALQGDVGFVDALAAMGATVEESAIGLTVSGPKRLHGTTIDMNAISDTAPTLAAIAPFATSPVTITGVEHMRWKETDRVKAMATELTTLGATVDERKDGLVIAPSTLHKAQIATYDDHRMAMSLAVTGLAAQGVLIEDPGCTSKTFPTFFDVLEDLRAQSASSQE